MKQPPLSIQSLAQIDNHTLSITWSDQVTSTYRLSNLQAQCPCAQCRVNTSPFVDKDVRATKISSVGRYAMKIHYTSGCSLGIYTYPYLRTLSEEKLR